MIRHENSVKPVETLAQKAQKLIANQPYFKGASYPITVENFERVLLVTGRVPSFYLKQVLQTELARLDGVERVENQVEVSYESLGS
jgi:hypothetical protein